MLEKLCNLNLFSNEIKEIKGLEWLDELHKLNLIR